MIPDNICVLPWVSIETATSGTVKACCIAKDIVTIDDKNIDLNHSGQTLEAAFNSDYMKNLRRQFINGEKPETCQRCWDEEAAGRTSKRMHSTMRLREILKTADINFEKDDGKLIFLDLKLGNICNLKCRICGSFSSSKWAQEEIEIQKKWPGDKTNTTPQEHLQNGQWPRKNKEFWENMNELLPYIRYFEFTGGEPFLIQEHFDLLKQAVDRGYAHNIEIHYNTNGTTFPKEGVELWPHFKLVEIAFSIDDVAERFEYQRFGANWTEVNDNIAKFQELKRNNVNIVLQHCLTVNVFNIFYLKELFQWMQKQSFDSTYFNVLHVAEHFCIKMLPEAAKKAIEATYADNTLYKEEVDNLIRFMNQSQGTNGQELLKVVKDSDKHRKQRLEDHHDQLARYLISERPQNLCLAPWTHTYISPQGERRMCCASREPAQNFKQYIDTGKGTGEFNPLSLKSWWNGEHMKSVRRRMMAGETLSECEVCNDKLLNTDVYRGYFAHLFKDLYNDVWTKTDTDGSTTMDPVSWDYRYSNVCNFKCRMCGDMLSSSWESEVINNEMINLRDPKNNWIKPENRQLIKEFTSNTVVPEFMDAVEAQTIREIYWVGGEPLLYPQHWQAMDRIVELNYADKVRVRYNTNLSQISYKGKNLYELLGRFNNWEICASLDGTGSVGEYIRTGLVYDDWLANFKMGVATQKHHRQMRIDFTLTLPGMEELGNVVRLANDLRVNLLSKLIFSFSSDILLSPLALPRDILIPWIEKIQEDIRPHITARTQSAWDMMEQLKTRQTFDEEWPQNFKQAAVRGKNHLLKLERIRPDTKITMDDILATYKPAQDWWRAI
jgi:pyruvate-formate lyase-activating enzyme